MGLRALRRSRMLLAAHVLATLLVGSGDSPARAQSNESCRTVDGLEDAWAKIDEGRTYRLGFREGVGKTHGQILAAFKAHVASTDLRFEGKTPKDLFLEAAETFRSALTDSASAGDAACGLREALNELMAGQGLLGNDALLKGTRVRFPGTGDPADPDQVTLLSTAARSFQEGIDAAVADLQRDPQGLRSTGNNSDAPFLVENAQVGESQPEPVSSELYLFTDLVNNAAVANNTIGKRLFFFGNVSDVDNFPRENFPGPEDLDFNRNRELDGAGRAEAAAQLKRSAHATYIHTAVLQAVQSPEEFQDTEGYVLKRQILDAQRVFDDILAGFNPLRLQGDFVPFQSVESFLGLCKASIDNAAAAEQQADIAKRSFDQDQTQLAQTLESQQAAFVDQIESLTGIANVGPPIYDLTTSDGVERLLAASTVSRDQNRGQLGAQKLAIESAQLEEQRTVEALRQIPEKIRIEETRAKESNLVEFRTGVAFAALTLAEEWGRAQSGTSTTNSPTLAAAAKGARDILGAIRSASLTGIESAARVKNLLLEGALLAISEEEAAKATERELAQMDELEARLQQLIRNFRQSRANFASAYFTNPAYRLVLDQRIEAADLTFEAALTNCYFAGRGLEYAWSERINNPVLRIDGLLPEALSPIGDPFVRAESVFAAKFADNRSGGLQNFYLALREWDAKMRQLRYPSAQQSSALISLKRDVLKETDADWRTFLSNHRLPGRNSIHDDLQFDFTMQIETQDLFPYVPNVKIDQILVNLVSRPGFSVAGATTTTAPANVELVMVDDAVIRTFFADPPIDDDTIVYELQRGRTLGQSPFLASVDATIDGFARPSAAPNVQLQSHSPAARWTLRMQMDRTNNRDLHVENLDDVELTVFYRFGKPLPIGF